MNSRFLRLGLVALATIASCGKDGVDVASVLLVSRVEVSPSSGDLVLGGTATLTATPKTASGITVPGRTVTWSSSNEASVSVDPDGIITARALGAPVHIRASVDGVTGESVITVQPPCGIGIKHGSGLPRNTASPAASRKSNSGRPWCRQVATTVRSRSAKRLLASLAARRQRWGFPRGLGRGGRRETGGVGRVLPQPGFQLADALTLSYDQRLSGARRRCPNLRRQGRVDRCQRLWYTAAALIPQAPVSRRA